MKKQVKKNLIVALSLAFVASFGVAGLVKTDVNAGAVEEVAVAGNFQMDDGAAIRIKSDTPSGIRWSVTVSESYYNYVTSLGTVQWGMVVDNKAITAKGASATQVDIPLEKQPLPSFNANDGKEETWTYYASITYDQLVSDMEEKGYSEQQIATALTKAYETVLYARAYNVVNDVPTLAVDADTGRSIKGVAMHCLLEETSDVTTGNKDLFETYAGGSYAVETTETLGNENAYSLTEKTGTVTSVDELSAGDYAVYVGAKKITDIQLETDGKISATVAGLGATKYAAGKTYNVRFINADNEVYQVPFLAATHTIATAQEYIDYMNGWSGAASAETNGTSDDYVVLTADINLNATTFQKNQSDWFSGTFNGLGHTLSNAKVDLIQVGPSSWNGSGLFGYIETNGIVENVALTDITCINQYVWLISGYVKGTVRNVYVQGSHSVASGNGVLRAYNASSIENVVVNVTSDKATYAYSDQTAGKNAIVNSYAFGKAASFSNISGETRTVYANGYTFVNENKTELATWGGYWSLKGDTFYFGDTVIAMGGSVNDTLYTAATTLDLTTLTGGAEIVSFSVNGAATAVPANGLYDLTSFTYGEVNELNIVAANGTAITQPIMTASHVISTPTEFMNYMTGWSGGSSATTNGTKDDYVVLTADIDLDGQNVALKTSADYFAGTFNGLGHTVTDMKYTPKSVNGSWT
ncbi:MAG: hypothetical protein E7357_06190, partial [Clostridiales bacterium]|nr:hypothetical protein [Clostridiales bacterium]